MFEFYIVSFNYQKNQQMMKFSAVAILATVGRADSWLDAYEPRELAGEDGASASRWNDMCFHCIDNAHMFCSSDGKSGVCMEASCAEGKLVGEELEAARGGCTLLQTHTCPIGDEDNNTGLPYQGMLSFS